MNRSNKTTHAVMAGDGQTSLWQDGVEETSPDRFGYVIDPATYGLASGYQAALADKATAPFNPLPRAAILPPGGGLSLPSGEDRQLKAAGGMVEFAKALDTGTVGGFAGEATANTAPSFSVGGGKVTTDFGVSDLGQSVAVQADGKILLGGYSYYANIYGGSYNDFALVRYQTDGSLDKSFGDDGRVTSDFGGTDYGRSVTLQADGKILLGGSSRNSSKEKQDFALVRYNTDGSLDKSFGGDGKVTTDFGGGDEGHSVTVQADGKILLGGTRYNGSNNDFALARYHADGSLDKSFGGDGKVTTDFEGYDYGYSVTVQADGKILLGGSSRNSSKEKPDFALVRYNIDGSLDMSFDDDGIVTTDFGYKRYGLGFSVTVQADGKILLGGSSYNYSTRNDNFALVRYHADGSLDTSFGGDGKVTTDAGGGGGSSVTVQADGKILLGGYSQNKDGNNNFALVRYHADGSLDKSFGGDGKVTTDAGGGGGSSVTVQADGKILLSGGDGDFALARYNADGSLDNTFGGVNTLDGNPVYTEDGAAIVLDNTVQIYDAELSGRDNFNGASITLARHGGADSQDVFSGSGSLRLNVSNALLSGINIGTVSNGNGMLTIQFNSNATQARVNKALSALAYSNTADQPPASVPIDWTFSDGNTDKQGTGGALKTFGSTTVNITSINDAPTLTAFAAPVADGNEDQAIQIRFANLKSQGNEADIDGKVTAFAIKAVSSGSLAIGATLATAKPWRAGDNDTVDGGHFAFWTPPANANGKLAAFMAVAVDDGGAESAKPIQANVLVAAVNDAPKLSIPAAIRYTDTVFDDTFATVSGRLSATDVDSRLLAYGIAGGKDNGDGTVSKNSAYGVLTVTTRNGVFSFTANDTAIEALRAQASATFTVTASDGKASGQTSLKVNIAQQGKTESQGKDNLLGTNANDRFNGLGGNDVIDGRLGADTMRGGPGNDTFYVDNPGDVVIETSPLAKEIDKVFSLISYTLPNNVENLTLTGQATINGTGNNRNNTIIGNDRANTLNGGGGADKLIGGLGNDVYIVNHGKDGVIETSTLATEIDTVKSSVSHTLSNNVENLILIGSAAINGTGNGLDNILTGNAAANTLNGGGGDDTLTGLAGADTMNGGPGNDTYVVDHVGDVVNDHGTLASEIDSVYSSVSYTLKTNVENLLLTGTAAINATGNGLNNRLTGNAAANTLNGMAGNDFLDGLGGADLMNGGTGNDTYIVDQAGDTVVESSNNPTEIDRVVSSISFTLPSNVENLTLAGTAAINATGNALDNVLTGNAAANTLNGGVGADMLIGGSGNDVYVVDNAADIVSETSTVKSEIDRVESSVSHTLKANVENLTLTGSAPINGTGNSLANVILGNAANNLLVGFEGNDTLTGGSGNDILNGVTGKDVLTGGPGVDAFRFSIMPARGDEDGVTDFSVGEDSIQLENAVFTQLFITGQLNPAYFVKSDVALDLDDYVIYNPGTGALMYDADGNNTGAPVLVAVLGTNLARTYALTEG